MAKVTIGLMTHAGRSVRRISFSPDHGTLTIATAQGISWTIAGTTVGVTKPMFAPSGTQFVRMTIPNGHTAGGESDIPWPGHQPFPVGDTLEFTTDADVHPHGQPVTYTYSVWITYGGMKYSSSARIMNVVSLFSDPDIIRSPPGE